jgi:hypothetical protein
MDYGDFQDDSGWHRFIPTDARNAVDEFRRRMGTPQGRLGVPVYIGHPDHSDFRSRYQDVRAIGRVKDLDDRPEGLFANIRWGEQGRQLLDSEAYSMPSAHWVVTRARDGSWRPVRLRSVGLSNETDFTAFANAREIANAAPSDAARRQEFLDRVYIRMRETRCDYHTAWKAEGHSGK